MKRWLGALALLLMLSGCGNEGAPQTTEDVEPEPSQTVPEASGMYESNHEIEHLAGGAWRAYHLGHRHCRDLAAMGENLLLFEDDKLVLLTGENLSVAAEVEIPDLPLPGSGSIQIQKDGVAYYDEAANAVVFLNEKLQQSGYMALSDTVTGGVYLTPDWQNLYYCTGDGIRCLSLQSGVARLVRAQSAENQYITGGFLNGQVLQCRMEMADGTQRILMISGETGALLSEGPSLDALVAEGSFYYLELDTERIIGQGTEQPHTFAPAGNGELVLFLDAGGALMVGKDSFDYYDLASGTRMASLKLAGFQDAEWLTATGDALWLYKDKTLYRWDLARSAVKDETRYTQPRYTAENPNEAGLARLDRWAQRLEETYGVDILFWTEPKKYTPWDYSFALEYRTEKISAGLVALEKAMDRFPEDFFRKAAGWTEDGTLRILLVAGIYGGPEQAQFFPAPGLEYYQDGVACIALSLDDGLEQTFYHELGHLIETPILSTGTAYYEWNLLNPWGFSYDNDYIKNQDRKDYQYLQDYNRYFIDMHSMSFAVEDRARILEYACMPGNAHYFTSRTMQEKLRRICTGIRETFGLEEEIYIWEQYLKK